MPARHQSVPLPRSGSLEQRLTGRLWKWRESGEGRRNRGRREPGLGPGGEGKRVIQINHGAATYNPTPQPVAVGDSSPTPVKETTREAGMQGAGLLSQHQSYRGCFG